MFFSHCLSLKVVQDVHYIMAALRFDNGILRRHCVRPSGTLL